MTRYDYNCNTDKQHDTKVFDVELFENDIIVKVLTGNDAEDFMFEIGQVYNRIMEDATCQNIHELEVNWIEDPEAQSILNAWIFQETIGE